MATQVEAASAPNGAKSNGKIKSKNQLRRLKAKQKKAEKAAQQDHQQWPEAQQPHA